MSTDARAVATFLAGSVFGGLIVFYVKSLTNERSGMKPPGHQLRTIESMVELTSYTWLHKEFHYSTQELLKIAREIQSDFHKGLSADTITSAVKVPMIPSFVTKLPRGNEKGDFLALDLGGTNFRILKITLLGDGSTKIKATKKEIPPEALHGSAKHLFGFVAESMIKFVPESVHAENELLLGFTFSFPCEQTSLNSAKLLRWTKGFTTSNVVGLDVVKLLQQELDYRNIRVRIKAMVNDTVGTLMTRALTDKTCQVGLIIGTGCNAAYVERASKVAKFAHMKPESGFQKTDNVIINTEMGNFSGSSLRRTRVDTLLDTKSLNPGHQYWEKMISGLYLGELVRHIVCMFAEEKKILGRSGIADKWYRPNAFSTAIMGQIDADEDAHLRTIDAILQREMDTFGSTLNDRALLKMICRTISRRAARVAAAGVFAILLQLKESQHHKKVTVAVDGSVFKLYPGFNLRMREAIDAMLVADELDMTCDLVDAEDGSGVGAAAVAASAV